MNLITLKECMNADKKKDGGYECRMAPKSCYAMDWYSRDELKHYWKDTGRCRFYYESHPVNSDGTPIKEE